MGRSTADAFCTQSPSIYLVFGTENGERLLHLFPTGIAQLDEVSLADDLAVSERKNCEPSPSGAEALNQQTQLLRPVVLNGS